MKNIIKEKPTDALHGRTLYTTCFISDYDIKDKELLNIGCGYGWFELNAIERGCSRIIGIEPTENDLKTAKEHIVNDKITFGIGSAIDLPFKSASFDTVVSFDVVEHIPKSMEDIMFEEVGRVLKKTGIFYLSTPYNSFFSKILDPAWWLIGHRHYSKDQLLSFAERVELKIDKVIVNGGFWEVLSVNNLYISKWIFRRRPFFEKFINRKQDEEYRMENGFSSIFIKFSKY
jgi:SAM-dependent methyltransferase